MMLLRFLLAISFFLLPCVLAAWIGSRLKSRIGAFFLAWLLTPVLTCVMVVLAWPIIVAFSDPNSDGTGVIMLPFVGIVTGVGAASPQSLCVPGEARQSRRIPWPLRCRLSLVLEVDAARETQRA